MKRPLLEILFLLLVCHPPAGWSLSFPLPTPGNDLVGDQLEIHTRYEDTLSDIARQHDLGYGEITAANPAVDPWLPGEGTPVTVPTRFILPSGPRIGLVINLAEMRLYFYPKNGKEVITYPIGIGREGWSTPTGETRVTGKSANPSWRPPESIRQEYAERGEYLPELIKPGSGNPLGSHAIYLGMPGYLLHGTNKPYGVGMRVSHGCIRLYPEDIPVLFDRLPKGTPVRIINQPYKVGWHEDRLYLEAHLPLAEQMATDGYNLTPLVSAVVAALGDSDKPDWEEIRATAIIALGIPVPVGTRSGDHLTGRETPPAHQ